MDKGTFSELVFCKVVTYSTLLVACWKTSLTNRVR